MNLRPNSSLPIAIGITRYSTIRFSLLFTIIFSLFTGFSLKAQNLDSLWGVWNDKTQPDTTRLKAIDDMAWDGYLFSQPDSAFYFAQMQYDLAEKIGLIKQMAVALNTQGISLNVRGDYPKALDYFQRSLELYEEMGNKNGIAGSLGNIGTNYRNQGNILSALDYHQRSLKIKEEVGDKKGIAVCQENIGIIYQDQGDYPNALDYYQRSLKIEKEMGDKNGIANNLNNMGIIYQNQGDYPKALDYHQRSLKIKEEFNDKNGIANSLNNIGSLYQKQGDYPKALDYFQRSLKIREEMGDKKGIPNTLNSMGSLYQKQEDHQKAINQCSKGLLLAQEIGAIDLQRDACKCLYDAYKAMGNGNKALAYHEQMLALDDSLNAEETNKKLQQMEFAKQMFADSIAQVKEKRLVQEAHEEEVAKKNKTRNILIGSGLLALLLAGGIYSRLRFIKNSRDTISKEKDRSENLLLNILPAEIAEELKTKGEAAARDFDQVSILFTDFKAFTKLSEQMSPQDLIAEMNHCFKAFDEICEKYSVEKIKTIGDSYMAAGGLPIPNENSVKNTVLAGIEMAQFVVDRKQEREAMNVIPFEMRTGIHTGSVVAGIIGVKKFQYDIWGDTVNTASRMESSGEVGKVNVSQATYVLLQNDPDLTFESRGKVEAKGKGEIEMYFVERSSKSEV